jgi:type IV pilus biogenesis protein CpaD/CtpE
MATHAVKVKLAGSKRYAFLTPNGGTTHLRIHAGSWNEHGASEVAKHIVDDNPGVVEAAKVVVVRMNATAPTTEAALDRVRTVAGSCARARKRVQESERDLERAVRDAYEIQGVSLARIGEAAGLSRQRIYQIVKGQ